MTKMNLISINSKEESNPSKKPIVNPKTANFSSDITYTNDVNNTNSKNTKIFNYNIYISNNKSKQDLTCKPNTEIKKIIRTLFFNFFYTSVVINSKNFSEPIFSQISEDWFNLGTSIFKTIDYYFQNIIVRTDDGYIFSKDYKDIQKIGYYKHLSDYRSLDDSNVNIFWLNIYISNQVK